MLEFTFSLIFYWKWSHEFVSMFSSSYSLSHAVKIIYFRKMSPMVESLVLHIDHLSRNINEGHLKEIFSEWLSSFGKLKLHRQFCFCFPTFHFLNLNIDFLQLNSLLLWWLNSMFISGNFGEVVNVELVMDRTVSSHSGFVDYGDYIWLTLIM